MPSSTRRRFASGLAAAVGTFSTTASSRASAAGANSTEEAAIRKAIAAIGGGSTGATLPDEIVWTGAYKKPFIKGVDKPEPTTGQIDSLDDRVPGSTKAKIEPIRIVIADSHDLAYEYSKYTLNFDRKSGEHISLDAARLVVWQKQAGDWKIAAEFMHPYFEQWKPLAPLQSHKG